MLTPLEKPPSRNARLREEIMWKPETPHFFAGMWRKLWTCDTTVTMQDMIWVARPWTFPSRLLRSSVSFVNTEKQQWPNYKNLANWYNFAYWDDFVVLFPNTCAASGNLPNGAHVYLNFLLEKKATDGNGPVLMSCFFTDTQAACWNSFSA